MGQKKRQRTALLEGQRAYRTTREEVVNAVEAVNFRRLLRKGVTVECDGPQEPREGTQ